MPGRHRRAQGRAAGARYHVALSADVPLITTGRDFRVSLVEGVFERHIMS